MKYEYALLLCGTLGFAGCSARPITSSALTPSYQDPAVRPISGRSVASAFSQEQIAHLRNLNEKAKSPRFAIVKSFYQLPTAFAGGAIKKESTKDFWGTYKSLEIYRLNTRPYAIVPLSPKQGEILSQTVSVLLKAGVRFVDIKMADAVKIMQAEKKAIENKSFTLPNQLLPSGADLLLSIEMGDGETGPIYLGRVVRTADGELLALEWESNYGVYALQPLITKLVEHALTSLAHR